MKNVLILLSSYAKDTVPMHEFFVDKLNLASEGEFNVHLLLYEDILIYLEKNYVEVLTMRDNTPNVLDFDLVYFKQMRQCTEYASAISVILDSVGKAFVCTEARDILSESKVSEYARLAVSNINIPKTCLVQRGGALHFIDKIIDKLGFPMIVKAAEGRKGEDNYLVKDKSHLIDIIKDAPDVDFVFQEFIDNNGDYRYLIFDGKVACIIHRQRQNRSETHLNNTSQGASARLQPIGEKPDLEQVAIEASKVMSREISGVDIMIDSNSGRAIVLEVNSSPQIASGAFIDEKLEAFKEFIVEKLKYL